jgi:tetratricopeptide (TPR) repeat protein
MTRSWVCLVIIWAVTLAPAQSATDISVCTAGDGVSPDAQINACTQIINAGAKKELLATAFRNRCRARSSLNAEPDVAIADCDEALRLLPNDRTNKWVSLYSRGNVYLRKGEYERAIVDYSRLLEMDSRNANHLNSRGNAYREKGDYKHAIADYTRSIEFNNNVRNVGNTLDVGTTLANRCEARALAGDYAKALSDCNEAIKLEPNETVPLSSRGLVYLKMGKFDNAVSDFDAAVHASPQRPFALYGRGIARIKKGDVSGNGDITAAKAIAPSIEDQFVRYGIR